MTKYRAQTVQLDGYTFKSIAESEYYSELKLRQFAGGIHDLKCHPVYELQPSFHYRDPVTNRKRKARPITYEADFSYVVTETGKTVVADVKPDWRDRQGKRRRSDGANAMFKLKAKMLLYVHGIHVEIVYR